MKQKILKYQKYLLLFNIIIFLALSLAALDDITTGNEPDMTGEWIVVIFSIPLLLSTGYLLLKSLKKN